MRYEDLTGRVIGCFSTTYDDIGFGLPESMYSAALEVLFKGLGLDVRREHPFDVHQLPPGSKAQLLTYLRATRKQLGLLLFYGPSPEIERVVL